MKEIPLTQGNVALVDDEDYEYLMQWKWHSAKSRKTIYAQRAEKINGKQVIIKMHRVIMNTPSNLQVDHIDFNGLNNQKSNMRNCTLCENIRHRRTKIGISKYRGVVFNRGYIIARIRVNRKKIDIGRFKSVVLAALAYDEAAKKYHGEFANLNFK